MSLPVPEGLLPTGRGFRTDRPAPDRNLALELVRVTEAAAMAAGRWVGRGDKNGGDGAAVDAMRALIGTVSMSGVVVIGEGEKDEAPMLYNGEQVGDGHGPECDVAVDPIDGTTLMAKGMPNAIAVMAVADRGAMYDPSAVFYMEKLATGPAAADVVDITAPVAENIKRIAKAKKGSVGDVTVCILDRPRHEQLVQEVREAGARIKFITDGDVAGRHRRRPRGHRRRPAAGHRRHPGGHHRRLRAQVHGRRDAGQALAQGRRGAAEGPRRRPRPRPGAAHRRPRPRRRLLRRHRHHRRRTAARRPLPRRRLHRPSRWSCARGRAPSARSTACTRWRSCAPTRPCPSTGTTTKPDQSGGGGSGGGGPGSGGGGSPPLRQPVHQRPPATRRLPRRQAAQPQVTEDRPARGRRRAACPPVAGRARARSSGRRSTRPAVSSASTPSETMTSTSPKTVDR